MKRFLIKLVFITVLPALAAALACVISMVQDGKSEPNYQRGFVYQVRALEMADPNVPKVLFIGGSYLTFSMDEKTTHEMLPVPSYCLGLHSGMGMCYILETAKRFVQKGDLIVFPFAKFTRDDYGMPLIYLSLRGEPDLQKDFLLHHPLAVFSSVAPYCFHRWVSCLEQILRDNKPKTQGYSSECFSRANGFYNHERGSQWSPSRLGLPVYFVVDAVDPTCFQTLNEFDAFCREKGAKFVLAHPPIIKDAVASSSTEMERYDHALAVRLTAPFVLSRSASLFPAECIYDCPMHLTSAGATVYTRKLCEGLNRIFGNVSGASSPTFLK